MITKFSTVYAGHIDLGDLGKGSTPAHLRRYSNEQLTSVIPKTEAIARCMDEHGFYALWLAEHHFQREGYECTPNIPMMAVHLSHLTKDLKIGCGFNIAPMWHPIRLAEDYALADIVSGGRTIFGVGRGYHVREVEGLGAPLIDSDANRELFEEQVDIIMKAFHSESFSHHGKHYTLPPAVPYRGETLEELTLVPRPLRQPVECWQPVVSASDRGLDFMFKYGMKGMVGGGAATSVTESNIYAYQRAAQRAGYDYGVGEGLSLGLFFHLADTEEQARREMAPFFEEHIKMFASLNFVAGLSEEQTAVIRDGGDWDAAGIPGLDHYIQQGSWFAGTPEQLIGHLREVEERYPALEYVHLSSAMATPQDVMIDQLTRLGTQVMPHFTQRTAAAAV